VHKAHRAILPAFRVKQFFAFFSRTRPFQAPPLFEEKSIKPADTSSLIFCPIAGLIFCGKKSSEPVFPIFGSVPIASEVSDR
jgi:hypothetical protein